VVIFTSDHGDLDAAHRMEHKTALYEEACRIPLLICEPGGARAADADTTHLVSNGLDLLPTVCDYAGVDPPGDLAGASLRPLVEGKPVADWRTALPVESEIGRMVVGERYKYVLYDSGAHAERLVDLTSDPGEMHNLATEPSCASVLAEHRALSGATP
jgi:choline-sulfatase